MNLKEFLAKFNAKESQIINYSKARAMKAVERDGDALRYVKEQTEAICTKAVERGGYALRYVDKRVFKAKIKAAKKNK